MGQPYSRCRSCRRDISVTASTIFHRSHIPLKTWFRIVWWATNQKTGQSAKGLQGMLGLSSYKTGWAALQKLRRAMIRPDREKLSGDVEVDKTVVGGLKRGRNYKANKAEVIIAVEIRGEGMGRIRLRRLRGPLAEPVLEFIGQTVVQGSTIVTDGEWAFRLAGSRGYRHHRTVLRGHGKEVSKVTLPRVHRVASLLKRWLLGTHQGRVPIEKLDPYLEEFTFRFNRRTSDKRGMLFYRLLQQCVAHQPITYKQIKAA